MIVENIECGICGKDTCSYIKLLNTYICERCEREITNIDCDDIRYEYYNIVLKKIWSNFLINF